MDIISVELDLAEIVLWAFGGCYYWLEERQKLGCWDY